MSAADITCRLPSRVGTAWPVLRSPSGTRWPTMPRTNSPPLT